MFSFSSGFEAIVAKFIKVTSSVHWFYRYSFFLLELEAVEVMQVNFYAGRVSFHSTSVLY